MSQAHLKPGSSAEGVKFRGPAYPNAVYETLSGAKTLLPESPGTQVLDPGGGGRTISLPDPANAFDGEGDGMEFRIINDADAAETLTVNDSTGTTIGSVAQGGIGIFVAIGGSWYGNGVS